MIKPKNGDTVIGTILWSDNLYEGIVIKEDAEISRDAVVIKLKNGKEAIMLNKSIIEHKRKNNE